MNKDNFKKYIDNLPIEVLILIFINEYEKFQEILLLIDNKKLEKLYNELKNLDPIEY